MYQSTHWSTEEWDCHQRTVNEYACDNNNGLLMTENEQTANLFILLDELRQDNSNWVINTTNAGYKSGYRDKTVNSEVGGAYNSYHIQGCAADIHISNEDFTGEQLAQKVEAKAADLGIEIGLGIYKDWIHIDTRGYSARW